VEWIAVVFMIVAGGAMAIFVMVAVAIARRESPEQPGGDRWDVERIAASLLYQLLVLGGTPAAEAFRRLRREAELAGQVTPGVDVANWGAVFAQRTAPQQRQWLLETAVRLVASPAKPVPLRQYNALLDLSFALGFQTDALAKLRERYGFDYVDHAKNARPREADRSGGRLSLFVRSEVDTREWLRVLNIEGKPSRQVVISAYRKLAAQHHPDRFHGQPREAQSAAAARFIEITKAYESLMSVVHDEQED
jgi:hypothetical protein